MTDVAMPHHQPNDPPHQCEATMMATQVPHRSRRHGHQMMNNNVISPPSPLLFANPRTRCPMMTQCRPGRTRRGRRQATTMTGNNNNNGRQQQQQRWHAMTTARHDEAATRMAARAHHHHHPPMAHHHAPPTVMRTHQHHYHQQR